MVATKEDQSKAIPLSNAEIKLIALGVRFAGEGGKMDYEKIAHYGGYTKGSAQVLYRKAHRKLLDAFPVSDNQSMDNNTSDGAAPQTPKTPSAKGGKAGTNAGKKRKSAAAAENDDTPSTASSLSGGGDVTPGADGSGVAVDGEARTPTKTPAKRQRKSPVKKTAAVPEPIKKEEQDSDDQNGLIKSEPQDDPFITAGL